MKKTFIGILVGAAALVVGVGGAYLAARALPAPKVIIERQNSLQESGCKTCQFNQQGQRTEPYGPGMMDRNDRGFSPRGNMGPGMFNQAQPRAADQQLERISMEDAITRAQEFAAKTAEDLRVEEVMEFSQNFYAVLVETGTGKGAMEVLIDPFTGRVTPEIGPNMMWNAKYGHMQRFTDAKADNAITMAEAAVAAQTALDDRGAGAVVELDGMDFYGYYSFDFTIDGKIAGMLSVNGEDGQVWFHNWHGTFVDEKEIAE